MPRVLVVDDDRAVLDMLVDLLRGAGYEAATCRDGKQVLVALEAEPYDLVLLDVLIPKLNGFKLIEQLRASPMWRELPVILMSGIYKSRNHRAEMTTRFGVIDYLDKPIVPAALLELLTRAIGPGDASLAAGGEAASAPLDPVLLDEKPITLVVKKSDVSPEPTAAPERPGAEGDALALEGEPDQATPTLLELPVEPQVGRAPDEEPGRVEPEAMLLEAPGETQVMRAPALGGGLDPAEPEAMPLDDPSGETRVVRAPAPAFDERLVDAASRAEQAAVESADQNELAASASLLQGSVRDQPLAALLGRLWRERATGALLMRRDQTKKIVSLRHGLVCHVRSNLVSECLGQVLLRERLIAPAELAESVERMRESRRKQGELLVEMGALTPKNLAFALELQSETKLFEMFAWDEGEYRFKSGGEALEGSELGAETPALIVLGLRRSFDEPRLRRRLAPIFDTPLSLRPSDVDVTTFGLSARELSAVRGLLFPASPRELVERLALDESENLRLVYALVVLELLVPT